MIFGKVRDTRFITMRRGGTLQDSDHHLLAIWAADCAQHVLQLFEQGQPDDNRRRHAIEQAPTGVPGEIYMTTARYAPRKCEGGNQNV